MNYGVFGSENFLLSVQSGCSFCGAVVVYEEVSQGVDWVVVKAVFLGQFAGDAGLWIMITFHGLYQARAARRDYKRALAIAGADRPADKLNALQDPTSFESHHYSHRPQLSNDACAGNIIYTGARRVAKCSRHLLFGNRRSAFYLLGVHINGSSAANVFIYHADNANVINLNPQAYKRIYKTKIKCAVKRKIWVIINRLNMYVRFELAKDHIFPRRSLAEHLGLPSRSAGPAHLCYAIVNFKITISCFSLALTVSP